jgi:putative transcriptional regulator
MAEGQGPKECLVALGYAGWGEGQLEAEIAANSWLTVPASKAIIFNTPFEQRWTAAAQALGIDVNLISNVAGHA